MAVAFHASTTGVSNSVSNGATVTVTKPTVTTGDYLIVVFGINQTTVGTAAFTAPAGWTVVGARVALTSVVVQAWIAPQSVAALGWTFAVGTGAGTANSSWVCASFSGVDATTQVDVTGTGNSNSAANSISVTAMTTVTDQSLEVIGIVDWNGSAAFTATGFTVKPSTATSCQVALLYANTATTPAGTTGAKTVNDSASAGGNFLAYQQLCLRPLAGGGGSGPFPFFLDQSHAGGFCEMGY